MLLRSSYFARQSVQTYQFESRRIKARAQPARRLNLNQTEMLNFFNTVALPTRIIKGAIALESIYRLRRHFHNVGADPLEYSYQLEINGNTCVFQVHNKRGKSIMQIYTCIMFTALSAQDTPFPFEQARATSCPSFCSKFAATPDIV